MFDTISCKYPLPRPLDTMELENLDFNKLSFQTKDLGEGMNSYEIKEDGSLWIEKHDYTFVKGDKNAKSVFGRMGHKEVTKSWTEQVFDFTGTIEMYDFISYLDENSKESNKNNYYVEYVVVFVNGKILEVRLGSFEVTDNSKQKTLALEIKIEDQKRKILWSKWYIKYGYRYYDSFIAWAFRKWSRINFPSRFRVEQWLRPL